MQTSSRSLSTRLRRVPVILRAAIAIAALGAGAAPASAATFDASTVAVSPDGNAVASGQWGNLYSVFARSQADGTLSALGPLSFTSSTSSSGCFCRGLAFGPGSSTIYSPINGANQVLRAAVGANGATIAETYSNNTGGISGLIAPQAVALSADARSLYVSVGFPGAPGVLAFSRDGASGSLSYVGKASSPGSSQYVQELTISPDGTSVYAIGGLGVDVYARDTSTGALTTLGEDATPSFPEALALSPDGAFAFVTSASPGTPAIYTFVRDGATKRLTLAHTVLNGQGGVNGLEGLESLAVSPDGKHLYAAAGADSALVTFAVDAGTGELTFQSALFDGVGGADGLGGAHEVTVSPDGRNVYVAARRDGGIGVFARDATSGALTFLQLASEGTFASPPGNAGLQFTGSESVSIDGGKVYTNDPNVALTIHAPQNATTVLIANDGGFGGASGRTPNAAGRYAWRLASSGPERLPKTVYVRFGGAFGLSSTTLTDDIVLDQTKPTIGEARFTSAGPRQASAARRADGLVLRVRATDKTSGVRSMQLKRTRTRVRGRSRARHRVTVVKTSPWRRFARATPMRRGQAGTLFVRVRDGAGNPSRWRRVTRR
jgi:6-phosphogluconolactonase (cycloisomerase 2 family)